MINADVRVMGDQNNKDILKAMRFAAFAVVASFLSLVVASPAPISNSRALDLADESQAVCTNPSQCFNAQTQQSQVCCAGFKCNVEVLVGHCKKIA